MEKIVFQEIYKLVGVYAERYSSAEILAVGIRAYCMDIKDSRDVAPPHIL
jgi:hypothetical protein